MDSGRSAIGDGPVENGMNVVAAAIVAPCPWEGKVVSQKVGRLNPRCGQRGDGNLETAGR